MPPELIREHLAKILALEAIDAQPAALQLIARAAQGSMRDALSLLDQAIAYGGGEILADTVHGMLGALDRQYLFNLLSALIANDGQALLDQAEQMAIRSIDFDTALQDLASLLQQIALTQIVPAALAEDTPDREAIVALAARIDPQTIQLYYQISILGRRDLGLAPDEFAGFSMTLLRMLAFLPQTETASLPSPVPDRPASPPAPLIETGKPVFEVPKPDAETAVSGLHVAEPMPSNCASDQRWWSDLVVQLQLGGQARMLALQCELDKFADHILHLRLPVAQKHLIDKSYQDKLREALAKHFGHPVRLAISLTESDANTPIKQQNDARAQRQAAAENLIQEDHFVRDAITQLDARIVSVIPITQTTN